jgi:predicted NBD/HSP70 family sugar kinase
LLREINDRAALGLLLAHGSMTRPQLVAATGLSKPTASEVLNRLVAAGLVTQTGTVSGARGPSAQVYEVDPAAGFVVGADVTPTGVVAAVADVTGRTVATVTAGVDLRADEDPAGAVLAVLRRAARKAKVTLDAAGQVVIASPGVHDQAADEVRHAEHMPAWARPGVVGELSRRLGTGVVVENDVNAAAAAERAHGVARDVGSFALLWVGPGLGLAIDLGGTVHRGNSGGAGEIGYMPLPGFGDQPREASPEFQTLVSGDAVVELGARYGLHGEDDDEVLQAALADPAGGKAFLDELAARLATGTAMIVSVLDPELVVLAGPTSRSGGETLRSLIEARLHELTPLRPALALSAVAGNPVLAGAVEIGLHSLRDSLFSSTS